MMMMMMMMILGFMFWSKLCKSLMLSPNPFHNMKHSSLCLSYDLITSLFMDFSQLFHMDFLLSMFSLGWCILVPF